MGQFNFHLAQLERDVIKTGAWQAKLAKGRYLLQSAEDTANESKKITLREKAKGYFEAVSTSESRYAKDAKLELFRLNSDLQKNDPTAKPISELLQSQESAYQAQETQSSEIQYKRLFLNDIDLNTGISSLNTLLKSPELTDTLKAKIYFQLIRAYMSKAYHTGQFDYLTQALVYCDLLCSDPDLKEMNKAKLADAIRKNIRSKIQQRDIRDNSFVTYIKDLMSFSLDSNKIFSKYIGLFIGNAIDFALLATPKLLEKNHWEPSRIFPSKKESNLDPYYQNRPGARFFKNAGFAGMGKWVGKYILAPLFTLYVAPVLLLFGLISYPFLNAYAKNAIKKAVLSITELKKEEVLNPKNTHSVSSEMAQTTSSTQTQSSTAHAKRIFTKNLEAVQKKLSLTTLKDETSSVRQSLYTLDKGKPGYSYAYGQLFRAAPKAEAASPVLEPVYTPISSHRGNAN